MGTRLGQHFLKDKDILAHIAREVLATDGEKLVTSDCVVEIGPGHGELTDALLGAGAKQIIAIERDRTLVSFLRTKYEGQKNIEIIEGDVRKVLAPLAASHPSLVAGCSITGNIPYYLTGFLLRLIGDLVVSGGLSVAKIALLIQKEVAERACTAPPQMNLLAMTLQGWAKPKIVFTVPRGAFSPPPKVTSALLTLTPNSNILPAWTPHCFEIAKIAFRHPRKTLLNNIREGFSTTEEHAKTLVRALGVKENARAALLTPEHVKMLVKMVYN
ncbi:MAG: rRNA adenine dimethyltransferase family protein [Candidatus Brennerbacteria bacterium]